MYNLIERKSELERELRLMEKQERTEQNMRKYWKERRGKVVRTVGKHVDVGDLDLTINQNSNSKIKKTRPGSGSSM